MSYIIPNDKLIYKEVKNSTIQASKILPEKTITNEEIENAISRLFVENSNLQDLFHLYKHGAKISNKKNNGLTAINFALTTWFSTTRLKYPELSEELSNIEKKLVPIKKELDDLLISDKVVNELYIAAIAGLLLSLI